MYFNIYRRILASSREANVLAATYYELYVDNRRVLLYALPQLAEYVIQSSGKGFIHLPAVWHKTNFR